MVQASIAANQGKLGMMRQMFERSTDASRIHPLRRAIAFLSRGRISIETRFISRPRLTNGEKYRSQLVSREGDAFMGRIDHERILVGRAVDSIRHFAAGGIFHSLATW
jgi:hypothetical protein